MSLLNKGEKKIFRIISGMLKKIPGKIKTRINLAAFIIQVTFMVVVFITPSTEVYRFYITLAFLVFAGYLVISIVRSQKPLIQPQGEDFQVIDMFNEIELIRKLINEAKNVDLICSSSVTLYDAFRDVIRDSKPNTRIFLRKWWLGTDYQRDKVNKHQKEWENLNRGVEKPFVFVKLHKNNTLRGFIIEQPKLTYGIFGFYIWNGKEQNLNELKGNPKAMYVTDENKFGRYLINTYKNRINKFVTPIYQAQILLEDTYLCSDSMSPEFMQGTFLHCQRTYWRILELDPNASDALQIAGLSHDIDRAFKNKEIKQEVYQNNYDEYKRQHSIQCAEIISELLKNSGFDSGLVDRVNYLVRNHENPSSMGEPELDILKAADSLTFFEYDVEAYLDRSGSDAVKKKMKFMYNKIPSKYKSKLDEILTKNPKTKKLFEEQIRNL